MSAITCSRSRTRLSALHRLTPPASDLDEVPETRMIKRAVRVVRVVRAGNVAGVHNRPTVPTPLQAPPSRLLLEDNQIVRGLKAILLRQARQCCQGRRE